MHFEYGTITRSGVGFQQLLLCMYFVTLPVKRRYCLTTPIRASTYRFGLFPFRSPLLGEFERIRAHCFLFLRVLRCFTSPGTHPNILCVGIREVYSRGFPHSDIFGSLVARHLPEAYRRQATSFIAMISQGIHRMLLLNFLLGNLEIIYSDPLSDRSDSGSHYLCFCDLQRRLLTGTAQNRIFLSTFSL